MTKQREAMQAGIDALDAAVKVFLIMQNWGAGEDLDIELPVQQPNEETGVIKLGDIIIYCDEALKQLRAALSEPPIRALKSGGEK